MTAEIQLKTNETNLYKNLRFAFSGSSVIGELMQNARRAGATHVRIDFDGSDLSVSDDGQGVEDLQNLLTAAGSGWDQATVASENPFGLGFMSTLYCARTLSVDTRVAGADCAQRFVADTKHLLERGAVGIMRGSREEVGTTIVLHGFTCPSFSDTTPPERKKALLQRTVAEIAGGFAIPVFYNGNAVERPYALGDGFVETEIGHVRLDLERLTERLFVQGLPIEDRHCSYNSTVIHLNSSFVAKLPDRTHLVDSRAAARRIEAATQTLARAVLVDRKSKLSAEEFLTGHAEHCRKWKCSDLLDDIPMVPSDWFMEWADETPGEKLHWEEDQRQRGFLHRDELRARGVYLWPEPEEMLARSWLAAGVKTVLLDSHLISADHWLNEIYKEVYDEHIVVDAQGRRHENSPVVFAPYVRITLLVADRLSLINTEADEEFATTEACDRSSGTLYLAASTAPLGGYTTRLVSTFEVDDEHDEVAEEKFGHDIYHAWFEIVASDPAAVLKQQLAHLKRSTKLAGARFTLSFDDDGGVKDVQLAA